MVGSESRIWNHGVRVCFGIDTQVSEIEKAFKEYTSSKDIAIVLINQHVWKEMLLYS